MGNIPGGKREKLPIQTGKREERNSPPNISENQASHTLSDLARDARTHARTKPNDLPVPGGSWGTHPPEPPTLGVYLRGVP